MVFGASAVIAALKLELKRAGIKYTDVAAALNLSESSVKRLFASEDLSLQRVELICELLGFEITDLLATMRATSDPLSQLTEDQERELLADPKLFVLTYLVLNEWQVPDIVHTFHLDEHECTQLLARLDRLGLIELLPGNRIKPLCARNFSWRKDGPVHKFIEKIVRDEFMKSRFAGKGEELFVVGGMLSEASLREFKQGLSRLVREFNDLARADASLPLEDRFSCGAVLAVRPWELSLFTRLRRRPR